MVVVFGERSYGRIEAHAGEHAQTRFLHIYYMPIVPLSGFWVTRQVGNAARGIPIAISAKSVLVAYLRMWGPVAVLGALATGAIVGYLAAALVLAAVAWAWTSRSLRGAAAIRRSDFRLLAFGTRCDPARMTAAFRKELKTVLDARWVEHGGSRTPEDVARFGASSTEEAVLAYGQLALAAAGSDRTAGAAAEQLLRGTYDLAAIGDGPYRATPAIAGHELHDEIQAAAADATKAAAANTAAEIAAANDAMMAKRAAFNSMPRVPWHRGAGVFVPIGFCFAIAILVWTGGALLGPQPASSSELAEGSLFLKWKFVHVRCDRIERVGDFTNGTVASACLVGERVLPVAGVADGTEVEGALHAIDSTEPVRWPDEVRTDPRVYPVYLEIESSIPSLVTAIVCICTIVAIGGFWIVRFVRRRRGRVTV